MPKAELETHATGASVEVFIAALADEQVRSDCRELIALMRTATKAPPKMWGRSIIGFGGTTLKYPGGRELDWMLCGFSPRKANLTLYLPGALDALAPQLAKLGKHTTGKGCIYIKRPADVDLKVLMDLVGTSLKEAQG